ncbi:MAG: peptidylprolyl isomerase [Candidatus Syntrophoarchaeum caldarius]|uniref:peptidylprolyl isomerase n=1 Tax=Candidatus Syntropharchaeum caldarium TaxID=1838285 RepID=A0A1F2PBI1_9EURY|nr:MAG: peptidylprolyl isomerase [Candidatus Syntrophoarchaeum caldarius]
MSNTIVVLETNKGKIEIELNRKRSPITVENFLRYVKEGHYDGTIFHRVIDGFMIQGGGYTPDGSEKPAHKPIKLESKNGLKNEVGTIAMARTADPDSATCQFFINVADNRFLDYRPDSDGYAVFGSVVSGMDVVNQIKAVKTGNRGPFADWPLEDIIIERAYVSGDLSL